MDETLKLANDLPNLITRELRTMKGANLKERMDLLNAAYRMATTVADVLKIAERLNVRQS